MSPNKEAWLWIVKARNVWPPNIKTILEYYKKAEEISPTYNIIYGDKATLFHALGDFDEAVRNYDLEIEAHNKRYAGNEIMIDQITERVTKQKKLALEKTELIQCDLADSKPRLNGNISIWNCSYICSHGVKDWSFNFGNYSFHHTMRNGKICLITPQKISPWESHLGFFYYNNLKYDPVQKIMVKNTSEKDSMDKLVEDIFQGKTNSMNEYAVFLKFIQNFGIITIAVITAILPDYLDPNALFFNSLLPETIANLQNKLKNHSTLDEKERKTIILKIKLIETMLNEFAHADIDYDHPYFKLKISGVINLKFHHKYFFQIRDRQFIPYQIRSHHILKLLKSFKEKILVSENGLVNLVKNTNTYEDFQILFENKILTRENKTYDDFKIKLDTNQVQKNSTIYS